MQEYLQLFKSEEFGCLQNLMIDDKAYFPAKECAKILGYKDTTNAIKQHCKGVVKRVVLTQGGEQMANFIPEGDLYRLIIRSNLPSAERFERWVFDEMLPSMRKHGAYFCEDILEQILLSPELGIKLLQKLQEERKDKSSHISELRKID